METARSVRPERLTLPQAIRTRDKRIRPVIRTVEEAIRLIDTELPQELQALRRWTFARALLVEACNVFAQKCIYLSVAGQVEFIAKP